MHRMNYSIVALSLAFTAALVACAGTPPPSQSAVTPIEAPLPAIEAPAKDIDLTKTIVVPASPSVAVYLPGIWYSIKSYENYQMVLLEDGKYLLRGKNAQALDVEDSGAWKLDQGYFITKGAKGDERIWRVEHAEEDKIILKTVKMRDSRLGDLIEFDRVGTEDLVGVWVDDTGDTSYRLILTADQRYVLEGAPKSGAAFRDSGTWRFANMFFIAKSSSKSEERVWDFAFGDDVRSIVIKNLIVKEGEMGKAMTLKKVSP